MHVKILDKTKKKYEFTARGYIDDKDSIIDENKHGGCFFYNNLSLVSSKVSY